MGASVGAVVLAAGASTRLGRPKQLVEHEGVALVARAARAALDAGAEPVVVVLGSGAAGVAVALADLPVVATVNPDWARGIGTSVGAGVEAMVERAPHARGVLLLLADQPLVDAVALGRLLDAWTDDEAGETIAAAEYAGTLGVPAVFGRAYFGALRSLHAGSGAAALIRAAGARVRRVPLPAAAMDVDTPDDLDRLRAIDA